MSAPKPALDTVVAFYKSVIRYKPLGIPNGHAKKALWPLLSKRLATELDSLQACEDDYFRRYGDVLRANAIKPAILWGEVGLFTGPNDAADPIKFSILSNRAIGSDRVDVYIRFTHEQIYCCGWPTSYFPSEGVVTATLENRRWVIDDYVAMYENDEFTRLSEGYPQCRDGRWVGITPR